MTLLRLENLLKRFGGLHAVDGISFKIDRGELVGLIGPNGSGKTTLFNTITGIYKPDGGEVYFKDERVDGLPPYEIYKRGIVRSYQIPRLFFYMTVLENDLIPPRDQIGERLRNAAFHGKWAPQEIELGHKAKELLEFLQLKDVAENLTSDLSGGQMKLTELDRALMGEPEILLLDEPTAGVMPKLAIEIFENILHLREERNITFFIIEHRLEMLLDTVERVMVMDRGRLVADGKPDEVVNDPTVQEVYLGLGEE